MPNLSSNILKSATHYSSLFVNNHKTTFSQKKLNFVKHDKNASMQYSSSTAAVPNSFITAKKHLAFIKRPPTPANVFCEEDFHKTLTNHDELFATHYSYLHEFCHFVSFHHCLRIVCSGLKAYPVFNEHVQGKSADVSAKKQNLSKYKGWTKTTATASRRREQRSLAVRHQTKNEVHSITYR